MKTKFILIISVLCFFILSLVKAQTVYISHGTVNSYDHCIVPQNINFHMIGYATGYLANDSLWLNINFGDGTDTTMYAPDTSYYYLEFDWHLLHTYNNAGTYTVTYIATGSNGTADTLIQTDQVSLSSSCDTISGQVFADSNMNCLIDAGEAFLHGIPVKIYKNSVFETVLYTDINGAYSFHGPAGYSYNVIVDTSNITVFDLTCPPNGIYSNITANGSGFNFGILCSYSVMQIIQAGTYSYNECITPQSINFYINIHTSGYQQNDPLSFYINFGDGTNTLTTLYDTLFFFAQHVYTFPGIYSVVYIVSGPDGIADTLIQQDQIVLLSTCGNLSGEAFIDNNSNCVPDVGEQVLAGVPVKLFKNGNLNQVIYTDINGIYSFLVPPGYTYDVLADITSQPAFSFTCPSGGIYNNVAVPSGNLHFGLLCSNAGFDMYGSLSSLWFRTGNNSSFWIHASNHGCTFQSGQVKLALDTLLNFISSVPAPDVVIGDTLIWNYSDITPFTVFQSHIFVHTYDNAVSCDSNLVCDSIHLNILITPLSGDLNPADNITDTIVPVRNAYDPNMKGVSPTGIGYGGLVPVQTGFTYSIYFQNTGNDTAYNIFIMDTLDADLDGSTFQLLSSSHNVTPVIMQGNILKFNFNHIMLPDSGVDQPGSHGYVTYFINAKGSLADSTPIVNTAYIYFDFNPAVMTNTVLNTIIDPVGIEELAGVSNLVIFPNPMTTHATIYLDKLAEKTGEMHLCIYDVIGREIKNISNLHGNKICFYRDDLPEGLFFFRIKDEKGNMVGKGKIVVL